MGIFTFDDGITQQDPVGGTWNPGDPWGERTVTTIADNRDTSLEDHVNADYVRRSFVATLRNLGVAPVIASTVVATFTRGAKVHVEIDITTTAVGTAGHNIYVATSGLPAALSSGPFTASSIGSFIYYKLGSSGNAISGAATFYLGNIDLWAGGERTNPIGLDPVFTVAVGDVLNINLAYLPAPNA